MFILFTLMIFLTVPISVHWRPPRSGLTLLGNPLTNHNQHILACQHIPYMWRFETRLELKKKRAERKFKDVQWCSCELLCLPRGADLHQRQTHHFFWGCISGGRSCKRVKRASLTPAEEIYGVTDIDDSRARFFLKFNKNKF